MDKGCMIKNLFAFKLLAYLFLLKEVVICFNIGFNLAKRRIH